MPRRIAAHDGEAALRAWQEGQADRHLTALAVRYTLQELADRHPGHALEVRVPPYAAVQILTGTAHRRGTPPAAVEMAPDTWLALATGALTWEQAQTHRDFHASGERADLSVLVPL